MMLSKVPGPDARKRERKGKERKGKERKGKERKGKERKGKYQMHMHMLLGQTDQIVCHRLLGVSWGPPEGTGRPGLS